MASKNQQVMARIPFAFEGVVWQHAGPGGWYFVSLPTQVSSEIRELLKNSEEGWGRLKATAKIQHCEWSTAIWFDTKSNTYLLPLKAEIRKKIDITLGAQISCVVFV